MAEAIMTKVALTQKEIDLARWHKMLCTCFDLLRGTIWWVEEAVWKTSLSAYDHKSTRVGHFGLSIRKAPPATPYEMIPMLHGTSGAQGPVVAHGLSQMNGENYPTSFGHLAPADLSTEDFRSGSIKRNDHKPKLSTTELNSLENWLKNRGLS